MQKSELLWALPFLVYSLVCIAGGLVYIVSGLMGIGLVLAGIVGLVLSVIFIKMNSEIVKGSIGFAFMFLVIFAMANWITTLPWDYEPIYDVAIACAFTGFIPLLEGLVLGFRYGTYLSPKN